MRALKLLVCWFPLARKHLEKGLSGWHPGVGWGGGCPTSEQYPLGRRVTRKGFPS